MKRRLLTMVVLMILVVSIYAANVSAASGYYNYGTSSRVTIGCEWNGSTDWEFYARAVPTSGITKLQLCDTTGNTVYAWDTYPYNPQNPTYIHCPIYSGDYISTFVQPSNGSNYTSGKVYWSF